MIAELFKFLVATDILWGMVVGLWVIIALPICTLIVWRKEKRDKK